jgi:hypothetical protein
MSASRYCSCGRVLIDGTCECLDTDFDDPAWCRHCLTWFERSADWCPLCEWRAEEAWEDKRAGELSIEGR